VEITTTWTAIRTDRALSAAHGGATLASCATNGVFGTATKQSRMVSPMGFIPSAYVADQESNPPREESG
jgi:hypothetical protein